MIKGIRGGYVRASANAIFLPTDFAADYSGNPAAGDSVNVAIEKLLGLINAGEELTFTSTVSAAGTTTLTVNSSARQELTGSTTQNFKLPNATTLSQYQTFLFINKSTGTAIIQYNDATTLITAASNTYTIVIVTNIGTTNGVWTTVQVPCLSSGVLSNSFTTATSANTASAIVARDSSGNFINNNNVNPLTAITSAAGTTTLSVTSSKIQELTGSTTQTIKMPDATTVTVGHSFILINDSTGVMTVQKNDASALGTVQPGLICMVICNNIGSSAGGWTFNELAVAPTGTRLITSTGSESTSSTTGGFDVTATSVTLPAGTWWVDISMQTINTSGATILQASCQLTANSGDSGKNLNTNSSYNHIAADSQYNPGSDANLRCHASGTYVQASSGTIYLRSYINISAGTVAYKGSIRAFRLY